MRLFVVMFAALAAFTAHAADVAIPIGDWTAALTNSFREIIVGGVLSVVLWGLRKLPAQVVAIIEAMRVEQLVSRSLDYGLGAVAGAAKGKVLNVSIANEVLAEATKYAVANGPRLAEKIAETLRPKLLARLAAKADLTDDVSAKAVSAEIK